MMKLTILYALGSAALFGASTPLAKWLLNSEHKNLSPLLLAGLLYLGSGLGLSMVRCIRDKGFKNPHLTASEWPWLVGAITFGGVLAPIALVLGLTLTSGSVASLLLNLEAALTAALAWLVFKEHTEKRMVLGMLAIVLGGALLTTQSDAYSTGQDYLGPALIALACLCWAIDNNLTRKVASSDALFIASIKGLAAGIVNTVIAFIVARNLSLPDGTTLLASMALGFAGYGISLVMFVLALRGLGAARAGAYFSTAPFVGTALSLLIFNESTTPLFWLASACMALGVWLHLTEHHDHEHEHVQLGQTTIRHSHPHYPDSDHQHAH